MTLKDFLSSTSTGVRAFGRQCGLSAATINRVRDAQVVPSRSTMAKIVDATSGQVTVQDLMAAIDEETKRHHAEAQGDGEINF